MRWVLVGSAALLVLTGCGRNWFAEREPWRHEAEEECLGSGAVREGAGVTLIRPISGPGICGADFPLKVEDLGETRVLGYDDEPRPPADIPQGAVIPRPPPGYPADTPFAVNPAYPADPRLPPRPYDRGVTPGSAGPARSGGPVSLAPPGLEPVGRDGPGGYAPPGYGVLRGVASGRGAVASYPVDPARDDAWRNGYPAPPDAAPNVPLSPSRARPGTAAFGPAEVTPAATLACPIVSALDRWVTDAVQPAALRWFAQPVVEIHQISAYSCRTMNGQPGAHISEHAFGNALDVAAFKLADGHVITVRGGWHGTPEEQGFLHDVQLSACQDFTTVLAPGSNAFHYDHIHVDLMRRASGRRICEPAAVPGEVVAARVRARYAGARRGDPGITGSIAPRHGARSVPRHARNEAAPDDRDLPRAIPGED